MTNKAFCLPQNEEHISEDEMRKREKNNTLAALRRSGLKIYGSGGEAELLDINSTTLVLRIKKMEGQKPFHKNEGRFVSEHEMVLTICEEHLSHRPNYICPIFRWISIVFVV